MLEKREEICKNRVRNNFYLQNLDSCEHCLSYAIALNKSQQLIARSPGDDGLHTHFHNFYLFITITVVIIITV